MWWIRIPGFLTVECTYGHLDVEVELLLPVLVVLAAWWLS